MRSPEGPSRVVSVNGSVVAAAELPLAAAFVTITATGNDSVRVVYSGQRVDTLIGARVSADSVHGSWTCRPSLPGGTAGGLDMVGAWHLAR